MLKRWTFFQMSNKFEQRYGIALENGVKGWEGSNFDEVQQYNHWKTNSWLIILNKAKLTRHELFRDKERKKYDKVEFYCRRFAQEGL